MMSDNRGKYGLESFPGQVGEIEAAREMNLHVFTRLVRRHC